MKAGLVATHAACVKRHKRDTETRWPVVMARIRDKYEEVRKVVETHHEVIPPWTFILHFQDEDERTVKNAMRASDVDLVEKIVKWAADEERIITSVQRGSRGESKITFIIRDDESSDAGAAGGTAAGPARGFLFDTPFADTSFFASPPHSLFGSSLAPGQLATGGPPPPGLFGQPPNTGQGLFGQPPNTGQGLFGGMTLTPLPPGFAGGFRLSEPEPSSS